MIEISNNGLIEITLGDYVEFPLFINLGNKAHKIRYSILKDTGAVVHFVVRKLNEPFERATLKKVFNKDSAFTPYGDVIILLLPEDTYKLMPGKYYYSAKVFRPENGHYCGATTIIPDKLFIIK